MNYYRRRQWRLITKYRLSKFQIKIYNYFKILLTYFHYIDNIQIKYVYNHNRNHHFISQHFRKLSVESSKQNKNTIPYQLSFVRRSRLS